MSFLSLLPFSPLFVCWLVDPGSSKLYGISSAVCGIRWTRWSEIQLQLRIVLGHRICQSSELLIPLAFPNPRIFQKSFEGRWIQAFRNFLRGQKCRWKIVRQSEQIQELGQRFVDIQWAWYRYGGRWSVRKWILGELSSQWNSSTFPGTWKYLRRYNAAKCTQRLFGTNFYLSIKCKTPSKSVKI